MIFFQFVNIIVFLLSLQINSQNDILRIVDSLPPSYDSVVKFDIPPPPYDCLVIDMEQCKDEPETEDKPTVSTGSGSTVHM